MFGRSNVMATLKITIQVVSNVDDDEIYDTPRGELLSVNVDSNQNDWPEDQQLIKFIKEHVTQNVGDKLHDYVRLNIAVESVDGEEFGSDNTWGYNCTKEMDDFSDYSGDQW